MRFYGVLPRIAICYFVVATLYLLSPGWKDKVALIIAALIGYWLLMRFVPVPGYGLPGRDVPLLDHDGNLMAWLDRQIFSAPHLYERTRDPEGLLSTIPALGTALIGLLTGLWLRTSPHTRGESARHRYCRRQRRGPRRNLEHLVPDQQEAVDQLLRALRRRAKPVAARLIDLDRRYSQLNAKPIPIRRSAIGRFMPLLVFGVNAIAAYVLSELLPGIFENIHVSPGVSFLHWCYLAILHVVPDPALRLAALLVRLRRGLLDSDVRALQEAHFHQDLRSIGSSRRVLWKVASGPQTDSGRRARL